MSYQKLLVLQCVLLLILRQFRWNDVISRVCAPPLCSSHSPNGRSRVPPSRGARPRDSGYNHPCRAPRPVCGDRVGSPKTQGARAKKKWRQMEIRGFLYGFHARFPRICCGVGAVDGITEIGGFSYGFRTRFRDDFMKVEGKIEMNDQSTKSIDATIKQQQKSIDPPVIQPTQTGFAPAPGP